MDGKPGTSNILVRLAKATHDDDLVSEDSVGWLHDLLEILVTTKTVHCRPTFLF